MRIALPFPRNRGRPDQPRAARPRRLEALRAGMIAAGLVALLAGGVYVWRAQSATSDTAVRAVPVVAGDLTIDVEDSGNVQAARAVDLPFQVGGQVREVLVKPGDQVRAGQALARIEDHELRLQVQQAE